MTDKRILKSLHVGIGNRGKWPLHAATLERGFRPSVLCDLNKDALAAARDTCALTNADCFSDLEKALDQPGLDCAIVCAPTHLHVLLVKQCISAGLPVLVEKGMAPSWDDACDLADFVSARGAKVAVAQNYRYRPAERAIAGMLQGTGAQHSIGRPFLGVYEELRVRPEPKNLSYPFASIWDMSCHHFDTLLSWFGPVASVTAQAWGAPWSAYEHPNNTSAHMVFKSGAHVHYLHAHDAGRYSLHVEVHGEKGAAVRTDAGLSFSERPLKNFGKNPEVAIPIEGDGGEPGVLKDFYRYVVEGVEPGISVRNNLEVMAVCQMMVLSIQQTKTILRNELADPKRAAITTPV